MSNIHEFLLALNLFLFVSFFFYLLACMIGIHTLTLACFHGAPH